MMLAHGKKLVQSCSDPPGRADPRRAAATEEWFKMDHEQTTEEQGGHPLDALIGARNVLLPSLGLWALLLHWVV